MKLGLPVVGDDIFGMSAGAVGNIFSMSVGVVEKREKEPKHGQVEDTIKLAATCAKGEENGERTNECTRKSYADAVRVQNESVRR